MKWPRMDPSQTQPISVEQLEEKRARRTKYFQTALICTVYPLFIGLTLFLAIRAMTSDQFLLTWAAWIWGGITVTLIFLRLLRPSVNDALGAYQSRIASTTPEHRKQKASVRIARQIFGREELIQNVKRHPISQMHWWLGLGVVTGAAIWWTIGFPLYWLIIMSIWLPIAGVLGFQLITWWHDVIYVTNLRILRLDGIFTNKIVQMKLNTVTDSSCILPWHSKLLAWLRIIKMPYGTIRLESPGQKQDIESIDFVPGVEAVYLCISDEAVGSR